GQPDAQSFKIRSVQEGIPPFGVLYTALSCFLHKRLFTGLEPVPLLSCDNNFTIAPRLHLKMASRCTKAPAYAGFGKGPAILVYCYTALTLFSGFEHVTFQSRDNNFTVVLRLPLD
ncbi:hypothetical protein L195_g046602, partial [Trifolium pratense]